MFIEFDKKVVYIEGEGISTSDKVPIGYYDLVFNKDSGIFLQRKTVSFDLEKKLYGRVNEITDHVLEAYSKIKTNNLGVLFSGPKGLGKSLTISNIIGKANKPVIFVNSYFNSMPQFLSYIKDAIIVFDEFEKTMRGEVEEDEEIEKQEMLLPLFSGVSSSNHNLFLLSVNRDHNINSMFLSRPGRIRYHYRFKALGLDVIREYLEDNLEDKSKLEEAVECMSDAAFMSYDILAAFTEELNLFKNKNLEDLYRDINITSSTVTVDTRLILKKKNGETAHCTDTNEYTSTRSMLTSSVYPNNDGSLRYTIDMSKIRLSSCYDWTDVSSYVTLSKDAEWEIDKILLKLDEFY